MILVDANLLLYAVISDYPQHQAAHGWLDDRLNDYPRVGLPWPSLLAFLRISTNPKLFPNAFSMTEAWSRVDRWLGHSNTWTPTVTDRHRAIIEGFLLGPATSPKLVSDAHLAAIAIEHALILCSTDGGFARFPELRWQNPIE